MTRILAHRGASAEHPENTLRAFRHALSVFPRAEGLECDIRLSADGCPVVFHDDETSRLSGCPGTIEARSAAEISTLRVDSEPIPTLAELLTLVETLALPPLLLNIELKPTGDPVPLIRACRPLIDPLTRGPHTLAVSSFDPRVVAAALDEGVDWPLAFLYETLDALRFLDFLDPRGHIDLHPMHSLVDAEHLARYQVSPFDAAPRRIRTWTVDDPNEAQRLIALGVDAIITNVPQTLSRSLMTPQTP